MKWGLALLLGFIGLLILTSFTQRLKPSEPLGSTIHVRVKVLKWGIPATPIRNMQVELYRDRYKRPMRGELVTKAHTNEQGTVNFEIPAGAYGLWVQSLDPLTNWYYQGQTEFVFARDQEIKVFMTVGY